MKSTRLHIKYREDKIFTLGSRVINDYVATVTLGDSEAEDKEYEHGKKKNWEMNVIYSVERLRWTQTAWKKNKSPQRDEKMCIKYLTKCIYSIFNLIKMSTCSKTHP